MMNPKNARVTLAYALAGLAVGCLSRWLWNKGDKTVPNPAWYGKTSKRWTNDDDALRATASHSPDNPQHADKGLNRINNILDNVGAYSMANKTKAQVMELHRQSRGYVPPPSA